MPAWQSGFIPANGIRLHYTRTGGDHPPVVLAHGFSDDGLCWTPVAHALEPYYDVVMVDARGHGLSDAPEQGYDPSDMAEDLAGVITGLGLRQPILLGHSMGAVTALVLAARHPALPCAIALEDPPAWWAPDAPPAYNPEWLAQSRQWIAGLQQQSREAILTIQRTVTPHWSEAELQPWVDSKLRLSPRFFNRSGSPELDWADVLPRITCPVLLITGDPALGSSVTEQQAAALHARVPQLRVEHIPGAGHSIRRDQFERYLKSILPQFAAWTSKS